MAGIIARLTTTKPEPISPAEITSASTPPGDWCIRSNHREVIARWIPAGATVIAARILVLGDVGRNATLISKNGGARIDVMGTVSSGARIGAFGGGAHVLIQGTVAPDTLVYAVGGGARVEFLSTSAAGTGIEGGAAEVLYLGREPRSR